MMADWSSLSLQVDLSIRLFLAAGIGALVGLERELHGHPAGMRTHLLVSVGAAMFTVLSIYGFTGLEGTDGGTVDPTRIAAQVVSGIGFLGAGAILKYGTSVRGLTTAASLWATAAIGMAAGAGQLALAASGAAVVVFSLGPLNWLAARLRLKADETIRIRLTLRDLAPLGRVTTELDDMRAEITDVRTERRDSGAYDVELDVRPSAGGSPERLLQRLSSMPDVELRDAGA